MAAVHWTLGARQELGTVVVQVGRYSSTYAASLAGRTLVAVERLEDFPRLGRIVPEYQLDSVRELLVDHYRLVYLLDPAEITVIALVHGSQDLVGRLGENPRSRQ